MGGESLRVAVVGLGKMGLLHASILNVLPNVKLTALCDKSVILRKFLKKVFKEIRIVDDLEKLSDVNPDAVYVTTPTFSHFPVARTLYLKEIARNLFVEKTLASSYGKAEELCKLAQRFGDANMVGYMKRFAVTFKEAKDLLAKEAIGKLVSFKAYTYSSDFSGIKKGSRTPPLDAGARTRFAKEIAASGNVRAIAMGLKGVIRADPVSIMKTYLTYEVSRLF